MAGWTGLEPAAFRVTGGRYNQLNYHPAPITEMAIYGCVLEDARILVAGVSTFQLGLFLIGSLHALNI